MENNDVKIKEFLNHFESIKQSAKTLDKSVDDAGKLLDFFTKKIDDKLKKLKDFDNKEVRK